jgi:hypothetical protein
MSPPPYLLFFVESTCRKFVNLIDRAFVGAVGIPRNVEARRCSVQGKIVRQIYGEPLERKLIKRAILHHQHNDVPESIETGTHSPLA